VKGSVHNLQLHIQLSYHHFAISLRNFILAEKQRQSLMITEKYQWYERSQRAIWWVEMRWPNVSWLWSIYWLTVHVKRSGGVRVRLAVALPPVAVQCDTYSGGTGCCRCWCSCCSRRRVDANICRSVGRSVAATATAMHSSLTSFCVVSPRPWFRTHRECRKAEFSVAVFSFQRLRRGVVSRWVTLSSRRVLKASMIAWTTVSRQQSVTHWSSGRLTSQPAGRA